MIYDLHADPNWLVYVDGVRQHGNVARACPAMGWIESLSRSYFGAVQRTRTRGRVELVSMLDGRTVRSEAA